MVKMTRRPHLYGKSGEMILTKPNHHVMKHSVSVIYIFLLTLIACSEESKPVINQSVTANDEMKKQAAALNSYLEKLQTPAQRFKVPATSVSKIVGRKGTTLFIEPASLETEDGGPLGKEIEVELKELTNQSELALNNAQTISDGRLLVSGGAYYIGISSDGRRLKIKEGKGMQASFPMKSKIPMELFYGERDSLTSMNWNRTEKRMATRTYDWERASIDRANLNSDGVNSEEWIDSIRAYVDDPNQVGNGDSYRKARKSLDRVEHELYEAVSIQKLGWINCDHFWNDKTPLATIKVKFRLEDSVRLAQVYVLYKDINSIQNAFYAADDHFGNNDLSIPANKNVKLIAVILKGTQLLTDTKTLTFKSNATVQFSPAPTDEKELPALFRL